MAVPIKHILGGKGGTVVTIGPGGTIADAASTLTEHNIGAVVVTEGHAVVGILSERDIVRRVAARGADALACRVGDVMTTEVKTCGSDARSDEIMGVMTERRIRHIPIVDDEALVGIISIGDVVKSRIEQLALEKESLEAYVSGTNY